MLYRVFLDTNIYDGAAYSFHNAGFRQMREFAEHDELVLVTTSIIDGEVRSHIKDNVSRAVKVLNAATEDRFFALFRKLPEYEKIVVKHKKAEWVDKCINEYEKLLKECKTDYISAENINVEKMVSDYFQQKPPFETKKPDEFKDSIAAAAVNLDIESVFNAEEAGLASDDITYCVVSNDSGFRNAVRSNCNPEHLEHIRIFDDLYKFLDYVAMMDKQAQFLKVFLLSECGADEIKTTIEEAIKNASLDIDLEAGAFVDEYDCIEIDEIEFKPYILGIYEEDGKPLVAKVLLESECTVKVWYRYTDEDNSYYDKEDQEYYWKSEVEKEGSYRISLDLVVSLDIDDCIAPEGWTAEASNFDFSEYTIAFDDYIDMPARIDLMEDDLIEEEVLSASDPFEENDEPVIGAYTTCPDCGKPINIYNDGGNGYCTNCAPNH